jgi:hypothetical protein
MFNLSTASQPGGHCQGTPPNCIDLTMRDCPYVLGCNSQPGYGTGNSTSCNSYGGQVDCVVQRNCTWQ